jgi:hypothetical protein
MSGEAELESDVEIYSSLVQFTQAPRQIQQAGC